MFLEDITTTPTTTTTTTTTTKITWDGCALPHYKGDGSCDDENNTMECDWDGGDCCGDNVNTLWCTDCQCLDPAFKCEDNSNTCEYWANQGYCDHTYVSYMQSECKKSCGLC